MSEQTGISYLDSAWNVVVGCEAVSAGCARCYAQRTHDRRHKAALAGKAMPPQYALPFHVVQCLDARLAEPLHWRKPRVVGVCFGGDLFHEQVPDEFIDRVFATMAHAPQHEFFVLTKRPARMAAIVPTIRSHYPDRLEHVWLGVSAENQAAADERIPLLLQTPAAHRWVSIEPMIGEINLGAAKALPVFREAAEVRESWTPSCIPEFVRPGRGWVKHLGNLQPWLDWVVAGGESGPHARPCDVAWLRSIVQQCAAAGTPCYVKQLGALAVEYRADHQWWDGKNFHTGGLACVTLRDRAGADPAEWPEDLRVQQMPWGK